MCRSNLPPSCCLLEQAHDKLLRLMKCMALANVVVRREGRSVRLVMHMHNRMMQMLSLRQPVAHLNGQKLATSLVLREECPLSLEGILGRQTCRAWNLNMQGKNISR